MTVTGRKLRSFTVGVLLMLAPVALQECTTVDNRSEPTSMPSNAPSSVKEANNCVPKRSDTSFISAGSGRGFWVRQGLGTRTYDITTNTVRYSGGYDIYGWVPTLGSICPNEAFLGAVYSSGF